MVDDTLPLPDDDAKRTAQRERNRAKKRRYYEKNKERLRQDAAERQRAKRATDPEAARAKHNAYLAGWRERNREKLRAYFNAYYHSHKERDRETRTRHRVTYCQKNTAKVKAARAKRHQDKLDAERARLRAYYRANADQMREEHREWTKANLGKCRALNSKRRARKLAAGGSHTEDDVAAIFAAQKGRCAECRKSIRRGYEVDHVIPIALGGSDDRRNLQLLCTTCNRSKHASHPVDFARRRGRLL